jgi:formylglycine-generating enzyme required for sulfatase activity
MLVGFADFFGNTPEAPKAKALLVEIDAAYAKRAEKALANATVEARASAGRRDYDGAVSKLRSVERLFGDGVWLKSEGKAAIDKALAEIETLRAKDPRKAIAATLKKAAEELRAGRLEAASKLIAGRGTWPTEERSLGDKLAGEIKLKTAAALAQRRAKQSTCDAAMKRAGVYVGMKRWKEASLECEKALEAKPDDKKASALFAEITRRIVVKPTLSLDLGGGVRMMFVYIKPGTFVMGGDGELQADAPKQGVEKPKHTVAITKGFYLGKYEVTQRQFEALMGSNPSTSKNPDGPVHMVTWTEAVEFCRRAGEKTRRQMRLPTEAEWAYACKAGTTTPYSFGKDASKLGEYAWYDANTGDNARRVGRKLPNPWGLYDMHGNVFEWVSDWYSADYYALGPKANPTGPKEGQVRLLRGGGWTDNAHWCRSAIRYTQAPTIRRGYLGFRAAISLP